MSTIWVSRGEQREIGGTITADDDISTDDIVVEWGPEFEPPLLSDGFTPTNIEPGTSNNQAVVTYLVDATTPVMRGKFLWAWVSDNPNVRPVILAGPFTIA